MTRGWLSADPVRTPLVARLTLLTASMMLASVAYGPVTHAVLPGLILLLVAVLSSAPLPHSVPPSLASAAEVLAAAVLLGALGTQGAPYVPYLLVPVMVAGLTAGLRSALVVAVLGSVALVAAAVAAAAPSLSATAAAESARWAPVLGAFAFLAASIRRVRDSGARAPDPAYADAHRLLVELQALSRQLSMGLEPRTLGRALLDDLLHELSVVGCTATAAVLVPSEDHPVGPLAGEEPPPGGQVITLPVRAGDQVVANVVLGVGATLLSEVTLRTLRARVAEAAPRLASALLFDDVRRLATVDERNRVAREIHDGIAQDLASLGYLVEDIRADAEPGTAERLDAVLQHVRTLVSELRLRIFDLRAGVSDSVPLGTAVSEYVKRIGTQADLAVHVTLDEAPRRLPTSVEVELLRILQEAVTNIRRHAQATSLTVALTVDPPRARLVVSDDGRGLQQRRPDSVGITGMRERAQRIGASLTISSAPGGGTQVEVRLDDALPPAAQRRPAAAGGPPTQRTITSDRTDPVNQEAIR